jgi:L-ascorbate peroxidase
MSSDAARRRVTELTSQVTPGATDLASYKTDIEACRGELRQLIDTTNCHPILIRLAWHDAGTFDQTKGRWPECGGANGSIRFDVEMNHGANAGLNKALGYLRPLKEQFPVISWADLIQLAGATAIEVAGGPTIPMRYGRVDTVGPEQCPKEGNLPDAEPPFGDGAEDAAHHVRNVFYRMGFDDEEIVALSGAHTIGRAFAERSGTTAHGMGAQGATKYTGKGSDSLCPFAPPRADGKAGFVMPGGQSWTKKWLTFDNSYFKREYVDEPEELLWLSTDKVLHEDPGFKPHFETFAKDEGAFFRAFAGAFAKLSERGARFAPNGGVEA